MFFPVWHVDLQVLVECVLELRVFSPVLRHVDLQVLVECGLELGLSFQVLWHVNLQVLVEYGSELECFSSFVACTFAGFVAHLSSTMPIQYLTIAPKFCVEAQ